jgi:hypothetical protein
MAVSLTRKSLYWTAAGVVVAVASLIVTIVLANGPSQGDTQQQSGSNNQQAQDGGIVVGGNFSIQEFAQQVRAAPNLEEARRLADKYKNVSPKRGQPAAFIIVDAPHHVWVRSAGTVDGYHIGAVYNGAPVWADCSTVTNFDPITTDDIGAKWLRIRWHTNKPNDQPAASQNSDKYYGWVYAGLTLPAGHNGEIPDCGKS